MIVQKNKIDKTILCQNRWKKQTFFNKVQPVVSGITIFDFDFMKFDRNCSGSHQGTKPALARRLHIVLRSTKARSGPGTQRIDVPAIALAQARRVGMSFTPISEKEERIARKTVDVVPNA